MFSHLPRSAGVAVLFGLIALSGSAAEATHGKLPK
jgi:hypothetical protein